MLFQAPGLEQIADITIGIAGRGSELGRKRMMPERRCTDDKQNYCQ